MKTNRLMLLALLLLILPASRGFADDGGLGTYRKDLSALRQDEAESISRAATRFKQLFQAAPVAERDRAFLDFVSFFHRVEEAVGNELQARNPSAMPSHEVRVRLRANGLVVLSSEGTPYLAEDADYLKVTFSTLLSPAYQRFLSIRQKEMREGFTEDAGLRISYRALGERAVTWETFLRQYPSFVARDQASYYKTLYLNTFLTGIDNSRVFGSDGKVEPGVRSAYKHIMTAWPNTTTGRLVADFYRLLQRSGFRQTRQTDAFLKSHGIHSMLGVQPPTR